MEWCQGISGVGHYAHEANRYSLLMTLPARGPYKGDRRSIGYLLQRRGLRARDTGIQGCPSYHIQRRPLASCGCQNILDVHTD